MTRYRFGKKHRIQKSTDFLRAYQTGIRRESRHFKIAIAANNLPWSRLGLTVGRKAGIAVRRNYIKRCVREYFRLHLSLVPVGTDIVFTAKPGADHLRYAEIAAEVGALLIGDVRPECTKHE